MIALGRKVIIKADENRLTGLSQSSREAIESGKLVLPETYEGALKKVADSGTVLSVGSECRYELKVGDRIYFSQFAYVNLNEEERLRVLNEDDIFAVIEEDARS